MSDSNSYEPDRGFFRCPVMAEDAEATILIGRMRIPVKLQDRSIEGFAVLVEPSHVRKLRVGPQWILESDGEVSEVLAQWMFNGPDGRVQLGLRRLRDLTPQSNGSWFPTIFSYRKHTTNPDLLMAAIVLIIFLAISLPGIGDKLGTSGTIQTGLQTFCQVVGDGFGEIW